MRHFKLNILIQETGKGIFYSHTNRSHFKDQHEKLDRQTERKKARLLALLRIAKFLSYQTQSLLFQTKVTTESENLFMLMSAAVCLFVHEPMSVCS